MCIDIPGELRDEDVAARLVEAYFADDPVTGRARYSGAYFERLGGGGDRPETAYQFTAEDLLAVSMLGLPIDGYYALHVLDYRARELSGLLARIPLGITLADPEAEGLVAKDGPAQSLWQAIHDIKPRPGDNQIGPIRAWQAPGAQAPAPDPRL